MGTLSFTLASNLRPQGLKASSLSSLSSNSTTGTDSELRQYHAIYRTQLQVGVLHEERILH